MHKLIRLRATGEEAEIAEICGACERRNKCCTYLTDKAYNCFCAQCGEFITWKLPSQIGYPNLCLECIISYESGRSRPVEITE